MAEDNRPKRTVSLRAILHPKEFSCHYDAIAKALYIAVSKEPIHHQNTTEDGVIVDLDINDTVVGLEILGPKSNWDVNEIFKSYRLSPSAMLYITSIASISFDHSSNVRLPGSVAADIREVVDWWRGPNESPGGCSPREAIDGMKAAIMRLETAFRSDLAQKEEKGKT